jgi:hypothetical protein
MDDRRHLLWDAAWFAFIVFEWVVIAAIWGLVLVWFLSWLIPPGDCTGIACP